MLTIAALTLLPIIAVGVVGTLSVIAVSAYERREREAHSRRRAEFLASLNEIVPTRELGR